MEIATQASHLCFGLAALLSFSSCGWSGKSEVLSPKVAIQCSQDAAEPCAGLTSGATRKFNTYLTTSECTAEAISAGHFAYQATSSFDADSNCFSSKCTKTIEIWEIAGPNPAQVTHIAEGVYRTCVVMDANDDGNFGNVGDYLGQSDVMPITRATNSSGQIEFQVSAFQIF